MKKAPQSINQLDDCKQLSFTDFDLPEIALDLPDFDIPECITYEVYI